MSPTKYSLSDLLYLIERLRDPETGCPWDLKQTFASIAPYTLEESYEVVDAIEREDFEHLREELGDLLLQIALYGQLARELDLFDFNDVVDGLTAKLIRRHPHVFPDGTLQSRILDQHMQSAQVKQNWEQQKQLERDQKGQTGALADVPKALPALQRAQKLQKRASKSGFDWDHSEGVWQKVDEELHEFKEQCRTNGDGLKEEFGDLLFSLVNLGRHLGIDAEEAVRSANSKFVRRFEYVEDQMQSASRAMTKNNRNAMETFWQDAKAKGY